MQFYSWNSRKNISIDQFLKYEHLLIVKEKEILFSFLNIIFNDVKLFDYKDNTLSILVKTAHSNSAYSGRTKYSAFCSKLFYFVEFYFRPQMP
jgi:hypothetical protein